MSDGPIYYTTRREGRSRGVLHTRRDCQYLPGDDDDVLTGPRWAFDPDQELCSVCPDEPVSTE